MSKTMQLKQLHIVLVFAMLLAALAPAVGVSSAQAQAAEVAPPVLITTAPADGETWDGGPVIFTFDKEMTAAAILVSPSLAGDTSIEGTEVVFTPADTPADTPAANTRYRFTVASAAAQDGSELASTPQVTLVAAGPLSVSATQPADGSEDTDPTGNIVVIFNRPVVPLTGVEQQADLPQPLTFAPAVEGQGQWISTSVYQWTPAAPLAGGTTYQVTVAPLTDAANTATSEEYSFSFSTSSPIVLSSTPEGIFVRPDAAVRVTFSQPMDPASAEAAFTLTPIEPAGEQVEGSAGWSITGTTLIFTPTAPLDYGTKYLVQVADTAQPASQQGGLRAAYESTFTTVPLPAVLSATIEDGAEAVDPETELRIRFSAPVSETTLLPNVHVTPLLTSTNVVSYTYMDYYENTNQGETSIAGDIPFGYGTHLTLNWYRDANTTYTVTVGSGVTDQFGNTLAEPYTLTFTTGDYQPLVQIDLDRFTHYSAYTTTVVGVRYRNLPAVDAELFRLSLNDLYQLAGENQWQVWDSFVVPDREENLIWSKSAETTGEPNVINRLGFKLVDGDGNPLPPGIYLLEVQDPLAMPPGDMDTRSGVQRAVIVLSNNNITFKRGLQGDSLPG